MALTPEELKEIPEIFVKLFQELEEFIIKDMSRRIAKVGGLSESARLQVIKAQEIGISLDIIKKKLKETLDLSEEWLNEIFNNAGIYSIAKENELYKSAGLKELDVLENITLTKIIEATIKQTKGEFYNLTRSLGFAQKVNGKIVYKPIAQYYHDAMDLALMQIKTGVIDYNTAIKQAVDRLCESGIRNVDFESGVVNRVDTAVRRAVLTGANQMTQKLTLQGMKEVGCEYVEVTAHVGARNKGIGIMNHASWQGKVYKLNK